MRKLALLLGLCLATSPVLAQGPKEGALVHGFKIGQTASPFSSNFDQTEVGKVESRRFGSLSFGTIGGPGTDPARPDFGVAQVPGGASPSGFLMGGYLAYSLSDYSLDAKWRDDGVGGSAGGVGASYGASLGGATAYAVRVGAGWGEAGSFSPNAVAHGESGINSEVNVSVSLTHAITPNMYLNGMAGAARPLGSQDPSIDAGSRDYRIGAGLGLRF